VPVESARLPSGAHDAQRVHFQAGAPSVLRPVRLEPPVKVKRHLERDLPVPVRCVVRAAEAERRRQPAVVPADPRVKRQRDRFEVLLKAQVAASAEPREACRPVRSFASVAQPAAGSVAPGALGQPEAVLPSEARAELGAAEVLPASVGVWRPVEACEPVAPRLEAAEHVEAVPQAAEVPDAGAAAAAEHVEAVPQEAEAPDVGAAAAGAEPDVAAAEAAERDVAAGEPQQVGPGAPVALPSAVLWTAAWVFRQDQLHPALAPRPLARFARAMELQPTASQ
jgi:hypothetical protein